jgi:hypothetical protein
MNGALLTTVNVQSGEFVTSDMAANPPSRPMLWLARPENANDTLVQGTAPEAVEDGWVAGEPSEQALAQLSAVTRIEATAQLLLRMRGVYCRGPSNPCQPGH